MPSAVASAAGTPADAPEDAARFGQFVFWIIAAVFTFGTAELLGSIVFAQPLLGLTAGLMLVYGACLLYARHVVRRGQLQAAVMITAIGLLVLILAVAPLQPNLLPTLILVPIMAVALALPFSQGRSMRWLILAAWGVGVVIALADNLLPPWPVLPAWFSLPFRVSAAATALGLVFLLLRQYTRRLGDTLAQTRAANQELQDEVTRRGQAEEQLRLSDEILRTVQALVLVSDSEGRITYANLAFKAILGYEPSELLGDGWWQRSRSDPIDRERERSHVARAATGDVPIDSAPYERLVAQRDGGARWIAWRDVQGPGRTSIGVGHDITERKQAEQALLESEQSYRGLFDSSPILLWEEDFSAVKQRLEALRREGVTDFRAFLTSHPQVVAECARLIKVIHVNKMTLQRYGAASQEELASNLDKIFGPDTDASFLEQIISIAEGKADFHWEGVNRTLAGEDIIVSLTTSVLPGHAQDLARVVVSTVDITERVHAEAGLKRRLAELEAVNRVSTAMRAAQTVEQMLSEWLDLTLAAMGTTAGSIWLYDAAQDELRPTVLRGWDQPGGAGLVQPQKPSEGIKGIVFTTGQPYVSSNFLTDPHTADAIRERTPAGGGACVPIRVGDNVIGTFLVNVPLPRLVTPGEIQLLSTLSEIAGTAIQRTRLHEQTTLQLNRMTALRAIEMAISASLDLRLILNIVLDQVATQLQVDAADAFLLHAATNTLEYAAGRGYRANAEPGVRLRLGQDYAGRVALERRVIGVPDFDEPPEGGVVRIAAFEAEGFRAYYGVPLVSRGQVTGVLEVFKRAPLQPQSDWLDFLEALAGQAAIAIDNARLFDDLQRSNVDLSLAYDATIEGWSRAMDLRDKETEGHTQRVTELTERLARATGIGEAEMAHIGRGALLHDIGKIGVPDHILLKPDTLTDEEWVIMRQHPQFALEMLAPIAYLRPALDIPYCHHEKWDGTGYPRGLKGEQIPLSARLFAVVDVWDALRSDRPYRPGWPEAKVLDHIRSLSGTHFAPKAVDLMLRLASEQTQGH